MASLYLPGGGAAAYALAQKRLSAALPGVAIATAIMPPLCVVGIGISLRNLDVTLGAGLLFLTNLAAITFAGIVVFALLGFRPLHQENSLLGLQGGIWVSAILVLAVTGPLAGLSLRFVEEGRIKRQVREAVTSEIASRTATPTPTRKPTATLKPPTATPTSTATLTPTPSPTSTFTPTPTLATAKIGRAGVRGIFLRAKPGEPAMAVLSDGMVVQVLASRATVNGVEWVEVLSQANLGWRKDRPRNHPGRQAAPSPAWRTGRGGRPRVNLTVLKTTVPPGTSRSASAHPAQ